MQALKNKKASIDEQRKMRNILKEVEEKYSNEDLEGEDEELPSVKSRLQELQKMMSENTLTLEKLTIKEQEDFLKFIQDAEGLNEYIKPWEPWWTFTEVSLLNQA